MSVICYCRKKTKGVTVFFLLSFYTCCSDTFDARKDCLLDQIVHSYYFSHFQVKICHQRFTNYYPMDSTNTFILPFKHLVTNISTCCFFSIPKFIGSFCLYSDFFYRWYAKMMTRSLVYERINLIKMILWQIY